MIIIQKHQENAKITGKSLAAGNTKDVEIAAPVKCLNQFHTPAVASYFVKLYLLSETPVKNMNLKATAGQRQIKPQSYAHHLCQTFRIAANFLYNSWSSGNTRFLVLGQVFNQSLWKLVQMKSTSSKTLKLQNFFNCKMLGQRCKKEVPLWYHFLKPLKMVS